MPVDILLISEECREMYDLQREGEKADKTVLLTSEREGRRDMDAIFKYQSGEQICMCLVQLLAREEKADLLRIRKRGNGRIIGFTHLSGGSDRQGWLSKREENCPAWKMCCT